MLGNIQPPGQCGAGKVSNPARTILSPQIQHTECPPRVAPTPVTAPPIMCVVEIGAFASVAIPLVVAETASRRTLPYRTTKARSFERAFVFDASPTSPLR